MQINDRVYGKFDINEPVLLELINSQPLQRLKGINQAGASPYVLPNKTVTRYEHSVGVMLLLKIIGAPLEEQIAGLLHDVPHTAFSHVIDYVFKNTDHTWHEDFHEKIIRNSEIPDILAKFGFSVDRLMNEHNFPLLERSIPDLCTDRIDYSFRDRLAYLGSGENIKNYLDNLIVRDLEIIFKRGDWALKFTKDYFEMDYKFWSNPLEVAIFQILADAIRLALDKKLLLEDDLFKDDQYVYDKLKQFGDQDIDKKLAKLNPQLKIVLDDNNYDFYSKNKLRYIDPKFINEDGAIRRVSEVHEEIKQELAKHKTWVEQGNFIKIVAW